MMFIAISRTINLIFISMLGAFVLTGCSWSVVDKVMVNSLYLDNDSIHITVNRSKERIFRAAEVYSATPLAGRVEMYEVPFGGREVYTKTKPDMSVDTLPLMSPYNEAGDFISIYERKLLEPFEVREKEGGDYKINQKLIPLSRNDYHGHEVGVHAYAYADKRKMEITYISNNKQKCTIPYPAWFDKESKKYNSDYFALSVSGEYLVIFYNDRNEIREFDLYKSCVKVNEQPLAMCRIPYDYKAVD